MKQAINTRTQEEYDALMKWRIDRREESLGPSFWRKYRENTCFNLEDGKYCSVDFYKKQGYEIIPFTEFAKANITTEPDYKAWYLEGRKLLEKISKWELPETGRFWDEERTRPMSYEAEYGSNGVRDYWKNQANQFLTNHKDGE